MFTGIIEAVGEIEKVSKEGENLRFEIKCPFTNELKVDQSIAHNGVCLTVVELKETSYTVTAIKETLDKTTLNMLEAREKINLERAMKLGDRLDGHLVQGHVDGTATCINIEEINGSWVFMFQHEMTSNLIVEKGSITINGVSLTVVKTKENTFNVAIIPYTFAHTTFIDLKINGKVNIEFDVIGKYVQRLIKGYL